MLLQKIEGVLKAIIITFINVKVTRVLFYALLIALSLVLFFALYVFYLGFNCSYYYPHYTFYLPCLLVLSILFVIISGIILTIFFTIFSSNQNKQTCLI